MADLRPLARQIGTRAGIPAPLFLALVNQESGWNPRARSGAGAMGLTQLMPGTARGLGVRDPYNPAQALTGGAKYLAEQYRRFGRWDLALSAYNSGPGGAESEGRVEAFPETQNYVKRILANAGLGNALAGHKGRAPSGGVAGGIEPGGFGASAHSVLPPNLAARKTLLASLAAGEDILDAIPKIAAARRAAIADMPLGQVSNPRIDTRLATPAMRGGQAGGKGFGLNELFYDPLGGWKNVGGKLVSTGAIGGHGDHVHAAFRDPNSALRAINLAQSLGLYVRENPYVDPVERVHTQGSWHYQDFPGLYSGKQLGKAVDVSGNAKLMAQYFRRLRGLT